MESLKYNEFKKLIMQAMRTVWGRGRERANQHKIKNRKILSSNYHKFFFLLYGKFFFTPPSSVRVRASACTLACQSV